LVPDLIVSDIMMPRMDGYEFFEAVRKKPHLKGVPFIFLTARGSRRDVTTGKQMGADDYLIKPFDPEDFLLAVQNKLQRASDMRAHAAETLNDARRMLVQLMSHELRTPLTYVTGGFTLLAEELATQSDSPSESDVRISLDLIQSGTQRLNRMAEQMVLYSEILSGYVALQVKEISEQLDLEDLVGSAITLLDSLVLERGVSFQHLAPEKEPITVYGVKDLLITAITEVIRNAVQYSPEGGQIELRFGREDNFGVLTAIDHGRGIPPEDQQKIWNVLIQSERDRNEQQGAGMGLPLAKGIIECHHGTIYLYSIPNEGTEVTVRLPQSPPESE
jgi:two-component system sensor histidine kinase/response regulator